MYQPFLKIKYKFDKVASLVTDSSYDNFTFFALIARQGADFKHIYYLSPAVGLTLFAHNGRRMARFRARWSVSRRVPWLWANIESQRKTRRQHDGALYLLVACKSFSFLAVSSQVKEQLQDLGRDILTHLSDFRITPVKSGFNTVRLTLRFT